MPDYAGCTNKKCSKRNNCCRYLMVFDQYQSVALFSNTKKKPCDSYWPKEEGAPFKLKEVKNEKR